MRPEHQALLADAARYALEIHGDQTRKGTRIPYASHLLQVAGLVLEHGGDPTQAAAGLLHDAIEDCEHADVDVLRARFGDEVARIVEECTDLLEGDTPDHKSEWLQRKRHFVARLRLAGARTRLVVACDKLHNLRTTVADIEHAGALTLERFDAPPDRLQGYYVEVRRALGSDLPTRLLREFDALLEQLDRRLRGASREP